MASVLALPGTAGAQDVTKVVLHSGNQSGTGNYGESFVPFDENGALSPVTVMARTSIMSLDPFDPFAPGLPGTVYVQDTGGGVQGLDASGSHSISGMVDATIEELIFAFDRPVPRDSFVLTLEKYKPGNGFGHKDDPVIFVFLSAGTVLAFDEFNGIIGFSGGQGILDLSVLLGPDDLVEKIAVREINDHFAVESIAFTMPVPTPGSLALLILGFSSMIFRRRRRRDAGTL